MAGSDDGGLTAHELAIARSAFAPIFGLLRGQAGGDTVLVAADAEAEFVAAWVRRMRRALYPMSSELQRLTDGDRSAANDAKRRRLRAEEYPETCRRRCSDPRHALSEREDCK